MVFDKFFRSFMSHTVITLKFRLRWIPEEAGYLAEKGYTWGGEVFLSIFHVARNKLK